MAFKQAVEAAVRDLRHGVRMLRRARGFTATAIIVLAIGIGANTAVFSAVNAVVLQPLPYPEPDRILQLVTSSPDQMTALASVPRFNIWREETRIFESLAAYQVSDPGVSLTRGPTPEHLRAVHVSADYFKVFGTTLVRGRQFTEAEDRPHGPHVVILSHGLWLRLFARDPGVVGRTLPLGGVAYEIVGITGPGFAAAPAADLWLPLQADRFSRDLANTLHVVGRLSKGVTMDAARFQVAETTPVFRRAFPLSLGPLEVFEAWPLHDVLAGDVTPILALLSGAVLFVLLIACLNVASLLLARGHRRGREIATRTALGASRGRIVTQLLIENGLLALAGGVMGLVAGQIAVRALVALSPGNALLSGPSGAAVALDRNVLIFTLAAAAITGLLSGTIPALQSSAVDLGAAFKTGSGSASSWRRSRAQAAFVVGQVMLALVLLVGAGLLIRTVAALRTADRGFDPRNVLTLDVSLSGSSFETTGAVGALVRNARQRLETVSGASRVAVSRGLPVEGGFGVPVQVERGPRPIVAGWRSVSSGYFEVYRIRLMRGRTFTDRDTGGALPVVIINDAMARQLYNRIDPIDSRLTIGVGSGPEFADVPRRVIGIVGNIAGAAANRAAEPMVYVPIDQVPDALTARNNRLFALTWAIRTSVPPRLLTSPAEIELRSAGLGLPVARVRTMEEAIAGTTTRATLLMTLLTAFAAVALLLAVIGLYGLMSWTVQQRTQEIGIRMALGALPGQVRRLVLVEGLRLAAAGIGAGVASALVLTRLMVSLVFGVATWDPAVFISVVALLATVACVAAGVPAHRATQIEPLRAFRDL